MGIEGVMRHLDDSDGDIRAMVGDSFEVCEDIRKNESHFNRASTALETSDMAGLDLRGKRVDDLFERLDLFSELEVIFDVGFFGSCEYLIDSRHKHTKLGLSLFGKENTFTVEFLSDLNDINGMVAEAFEVSDCVKDL